jgi:hypothetical protein
MKACARAGLIGAAAALALAGAAAISVTPRLLPLSLFSIFRRIALAVIVNDPVLN